MIKIEFNSPLNYGETVYFLKDGRVQKGELQAIYLNAKSENTRATYAVLVGEFRINCVDEVFTSQEELFKAIMLKEDTDEKEGEAIRK